MQLGSWLLETVSGGTFWLDAGAMYGVVPKTVWQNVTPPDALNRIPFATNCVLARNGRHTVLVDTGYGGKAAGLERKAYGMEPGEPLLVSLAALGVRPEEIDIVVFSHLHFDHVGGAVRYDAARRLVPTFPSASHFIQRHEWLDAASGAPELQGSYFEPNFLPLEAAGQVRLVDGDVEIVPGLRTRVTGGHTRGHQALVFESAGESAIYLGDLCPVTTHMRRMWIASYDLYPLDVRRRKPELLGEAADRHYWVLWDHDPQIAVSRIGRNPKRDFDLVEPRDRL